MRSYFLLTGLVAVIGAGFLPAVRAADSSPVQSASIDGYLASDGDAWRKVLASPPRTGSLQGQIDLSAIELLQREASAARWKQAKHDEDAPLYSVFSPILSIALERRRVPVTIHVLNRALKDLDIELVAAKTQFQRPRPFQRVRLSRVCSPNEPTDKAVADVRYDSYPSGHAARGWLVALLLAKAAPDRRNQLFALASDYGFSREVCGMHFPSDVETGRVIAVDLFRRLENSPSFLRDSACMVEENRGEQAISRWTNPRCSGLKAGPRSRAEA